MALFLILFLIEILAASSLPGVVKSLKPVCLSPARALLTRFAAALLPALWRRPPQRSACRSASASEMGLWTTSE